jgi:hypothetical protein
VKWNATNILRALAVLSALVQAVDEVLTTVKHNGSSPAPATTSTEGA